jgi:hypothetical protein
VFIFHTICNLYQSWLHTKLIGKLHRYFEFTFNTPSHHRVHHSSNVEYLDKNHGGILIIWDRLLGTFQEEKAKTVFGLTSETTFKGVSDVLWKSWREIFVNVRTSGNLNNAINHLIKAPGWSVDGRTMTVRQIRQISYLKGLAPTGNLNKNRALRPTLANVSLADETKDYPLGTLLTSTTKSPDSNDNTYAQCF